MMDSKTINKKVLLIDQIARVTYKYTYSLANALSDRGIKLELVIDDKDDNDDCKVKAHNRFHTSRKNISKPEKLVNYILSYQYICNTVQKGAFDVVHAQWFPFSPVDYYYLKKIKKSGRRIITTVHDILPFNCKSYDPYFHRKIYELSDAIIVQAKANIDRFNERFPGFSDKVTYIPLGNSLEFAGDCTPDEARARLKLPRDKHILLFFGQIKKVKGVGVLLEAFGQLAKERDDLFLVIAGNVWKDDFSVYQEIIDRYGLDERNLKTEIRFIPDEEIDVYYAACDLTVLPYLDVYQSAVIQLAYAYKKTVIATALPAFTELVEEGKTGFVCEPDDVESLKSAIMRALDAKDEWKSIGEAGYQKVKEQCAWEDIAEKTAALYQTGETPPRKYKPICIPSHEKPDVSIVIPVYNRFDYTYSCLQHIAANSGSVSYEVILADDHSTDETKEAEKLISGIKVIHNQNTKGFLMNCNHAAAHAKGCFLMFLNNDTHVQKNWLQPLLDIMKDESVGMTGSKLIYNRETLQEAGGIIWKDGSACNYGNRKSPTNPAYNYVKDVDYISGASILIRRTLWDEIGGFDTRFAPAYYEDVDLAFEVRKRGYRVVYQPLSVVVHFEGISNGRSLRSGQKHYQVINQKKFYEKWKGVLAAENMRQKQHVFLARDRSREKKHILVIDRHVPFYDKNARDGRIDRALQQHIKKGYHVTLIGDDGTAYEPYTTRLRQMGIEVWAGDEANRLKRELGKTLRYFDRIYIMDASITPGYAGLMKRHGKRVKVYDDLSVR